MSLPARPLSTPRTRRDLPYTYAAICGLLVMALHTMGLGVLDPSKVLRGDAVALDLPLIWPYLALCAGVAAQRRWARDLAAPAAFMALVAALAVLPRYEFLSLGAAQDPRFAARAPAVWLLFRRQLAVQGLHALLCGGALYALTRPEMAAACERRAQQPEWTVGLGFAGATLLVWEFFAASRAVDKALTLLGSRAPRDSGLVLGLAALSLAALVGLWRRRWWGRLAAGAQALSLAGGLLAHALDAAGGAYAAALPKAPLAAAFLAGEAFCRSLPELSVALCALAAFAFSGRYFPFGSPGPFPPAQPANAAPLEGRKRRRDYEPW